MLKYNYIFLITYTEAILSNSTRKLLWFMAVVKLLSKRWWIPIGATPEGLKLEPEGPRAEVGFLTADQGFSSISRNSL